MVNKSIEIDKVVSYLKGVSSIDTLVSDRIYFGEPMHEVSPDWVYIVVNVVSQNADVVNKMARLEFRFIWPSENTTKKQLIDIQNLTTDSIVYMPNIISWVYKVVEWGTFQAFVDEKNRNMLIKDYLFYFLS